MHTQPSRESRKGGEAQEAKPDSSWRGGQRAACLPRTLTGVVYSTPFHPHSPSWPWILPGIPHVHLKAICLLIHLPSPHLQCLPPTWLLRAPPTRLPLLWVRLHSMDILQINLLSVHGTLAPPSHQHSSLFSEQGPEPQNDVQLLPGPGPTSVLPLDSLPTTSWIYFSSLLPTRAPDLLPPPSPTCVSAWAGCSPLNLKSSSSCKLSSKYYFFHEALLVLPARETFAFPVIR